MVGSIASYRHFIGTGKHTRQQEHLMAAKGGVSRPVEHLRPKLIEAVHETRRDSHLNQGADHP